MIQHAIPDSHNTASPDRLSEARNAFRTFYAQCFWYWRKDMPITESDIPEIARGLRQHGGRQGFLLADKLCP